MFALTNLPKIAEEFQLPKYRLNQVREWIFQRYVADFNDMSNLPVKLRQSLTAKYKVTESLVVAEQKTGDGTVKLLIQYPDGAKIEAVVMSYRDWSTACVSTQVGCAMGCKFCATGSSGIERNLTTEEMVEQLWHCYHYAQSHSLKPIRNMVLMGIGEPLANYRNVVDFIRVANDPDYFGMGQRRITISTVGLVPQINSLAELNLSITLAVSLHAPNDKLRHSLMPITSKYPLQDLIAACRNYIFMTGRRVTFEYLLLADVNDQDSHAKELIRLLRGVNCQVNVIPFNKIAGTTLRPSRRLKQFQDVLAAGGINVTIRRSLGGEISAACGQLRKDRE